MGLFSLFGLGSGKDSKYKKLHKIIGNHYTQIANMLPGGSIEEYEKSRYANQSAEYELLSLLGKDEQTVKLLSKYNLQVEHLKEIYKTIILNGGGQFIGGQIFTCHSSYRYKSFNLPC